jgi:hypothetical protein
MADETTQAQAAESNEATVDTTAAETASTEATNQQTEAQAPTLEDASLDDLDALASQFALDEEKPETPEPPKQEAESEEEEPQETEETDEDEEEEAAEEQKPKVANRIRLTDLKDQDKALVSTAVQMVKDGLAGSIPEAIAKLSGQPQAKATEQAQQEQEPQEQQPSRTDAIKSEILEIKAALKEAKDAFEGDREMDLLEALADAKAELRLEEFKSEQAQQQEQQQALTTYEREYADARETVKQLYPDGENPESEFAQALRAEIARKEQVNPEFFNDPQYPVDLASKVAARLGIAPATAKTAPAAKAPQAKQSTSVPVPKVAARPASPVVGGNATTNPDATSIGKMLESLNADDLDAVAEALR